MHGMHRMVLSGVDREMNLHHRHPFWLENTLRSTILNRRTTLRTSTETPKETDDTNDADNVPMSETPVNDGRNASHIKSKSSAADTDGVRQRLKFDGEASGMTPDPKKEKTFRKRDEEWETRIQVAGVPGRLLCPGSFMLHWTHCGHSLTQTSCANLHSELHGCLSSGTRAG